jgi:hypothetical protein
MLDKLLELGTVFDWISPVMAAIQDRLNGPSHTFMIPDDCGWSGFQIEYLLKSHGIRPWRRMVIKHMIMLTVRLAQARYAQYLLLRAQIPIEYGLLEERASSAAAGKPRRAQNGRAAPKAKPKRGIFAELSQVLDSLVDEVEAMLGLRG